jgi:hypothetical protein
MIYSKWDKDSAMQIRGHPSVVGRNMQGKAYNRRTALTTLMPTRVFAKKFRLRPAACCSDGFVRLATRHTVAR